MRDTWPCDVDNKRKYDIISKKKAHTHTCTYEVLTFKIFREPVAYYGQSDSSCVCTYLYVQWHRQSTHRAIEDKWKWEKRKKERKN